MDIMPLNTFRPKGWLREQIRLNGEGFFGHLTDISDFLKDSNGWLQWQKTAEDFAAEMGKPAAEYQSFGWEEQAYWLRGAYRLALLGDNPALMAQCEPYFEAINIISTADLPDEFRNTVRLGWNTLSLCPNCAAKYRYSGKKLSGFMEQVEAAEIVLGDDELIVLTIELAGRTVGINFTPKHFLALREGLKRLG